jgi:hypothetical protein
MPFRGKDKKVRQAKFVLKKKPLEILVAYPLSQKLERCTDLFWNRIYMNNVDRENLAGIARITCGWKKPHLPLEQVRRYWRDVHSPAISRRAGIYEYRHLQFDTVQSDVFAPIAGIDTQCPDDQQLMWLSDVRYRDDADLEIFGKSPSPEVRAEILADIDLLVDQSTTYKAVGDWAKTYIDECNEPLPAGPARANSYSVFFRQRSGLEDFQACVRGIAARWAKTAGVLRVRLSLFEAPDMEAERKAGYPIKTHPIERQYQAWIDVVFADAQVPSTLLSAADNVDYAAHISEVHCYPVASLFKFVDGGKPTLIALRGYAAYESIRFFDAQHQMNAGLLEWMYGPVAANYEAIDFGNQAKQVNA